MFLGILDTILYGGISLFFLAVMLLMLYFGIFNEVNNRKGSSFSELLFYGISALAGISYFIFPSFFEASFAQNGEFIILNEFVLFFILFYLGWAQNIKSNTVKAIATYGLLAIYVVFMGLFSGNFWVMLILAYQVYQVAKNQDKFIDWMLFFLLITLPCIFISMNLGGESPSFVSTSGIAFFMASFFTIKFVIALLILRKPQDSSPGSIQLKPGKKASKPRVSS